MHGAGFKSGPFAMLWPGLDPGFFRRTGHCAPSRAARFGRSLAGRVADAIHSKEGFKRTLRMIPGRCVVAVSFLAL